MAAWGEGDPRWICEERADGTNVNNWHWTERKFTFLTKKEFEGRFLNKELIEKDGTSVTITTIKIEGDTYANNRKGKVIISYDQELEFEFKATKDEETYEGSIKIPNFDDTNDADDFDYQVTVKKNTKEANAVKQLIRVDGAKIMNKFIEEYRITLKNYSHSSVILPTHSKDELNKKRDASPAHKKTNESVSTGVPVESKKSNVGGVKIVTKNYETSLEFKCSAMDAFLVLTDQQRIQAWARSEVKMDSFVGGEFSLFGGGVTGKFVEIESGRTIVMDWRRKSWPAGHLSKVTISIKEGDDSTKLDLKQTGIPVSDFEPTCQGWKMNYFQNINATFGYGANFGSF